MDEMPDPWPLWGLELRTPRLTLRPDEDAGLGELMAEALRGVHPPAEMPFGFPWTDKEPLALVREGLQHHWASRVSWRPDNWEVNFLVRFEGQVIGNQGVRAKDFAVTREIGSGSWIGMRHQGRGIGTEMRAAVLMFAFDCLGARTARSEAFLDNPSSNAVSRKLGYVVDGTEVLVRRGEAAVQQRLLVTPDTFRRPDWKLETSGVEPALPMFGAA